MEPGTIQESGRTIEMVVARVVDQLAAQVKGKVAHIDIFAVGGQDVGKRSRHRQPINLRLPVVGIE